jgi:hypothetical protein
MNAPTRPVGVETRGTTADRRLRRVDRWLLATRPALLRRPDLLVVDLGFGERPVTTIELAKRLRRVNPQVRVVGLDISADRVAAAQARSTDGLEFAVGGFELAGLRPHVVRAFNVLRQYDAADVPAAWQRMQQQLAPGGLLLDGTCDETGGLAAWLTVDAEAPRSLTLGLHPALPPSAVAARLPKALIHGNVPGRPVHRLLEDLDRAWQARAALGVFGFRQRMAAAVHEVRRQGWPVVDGPGRWRRGDLTVSWRALASSAR